MLTKKRLTKILIPLILAVSVTMEPSQSGVATSSLAFNNTGTVFLGECSGDHGSCG